MIPLTILARALSQAFVSGPLRVESMVDRGAAVLGRKWRWLRPLAMRVVAHFPEETRPLQIAITKFLMADVGLWNACSNHKITFSGSATKPTMVPVFAARGWPIPALRSGAELAVWLGLTYGELNWFADRRSLESKRNRGRLRHYHYRLVKKKSGGQRLVEVPKPRLKELQRQILEDIVGHIPCHHAAHGFRRGHSIKTFASPHVGKQTVLKMDLQDFFPSIGVAKIHALFRAVGFPDEVADYLSGICTNTTPEDTCEGQMNSSWRTRQIRWRYSEPHLPQGAPTSPALANLCAYRIDCRLCGLAGSMGATYSRYADDFAFSGGAEFSRSVSRLIQQVDLIVRQEGFRIHKDKTRTMKRGGRQKLGGMIVNQHLNVSRDDFDRLKATLTNCVRFGPSSQNRSGHHDFRSHLAGRVGFVAMVNPHRGKRLRQLFDQISWTQSATK